MTDEGVAALLQSDAPLVLIEAPAGCGKTFQAAAFASHVASQIGQKKVLVLTHTHAACSVIAKRTKEIRHHVELRTLDGFIHEIASAYYRTMGLPEDVAMWARTTTNGFEILASKVAEFIKVNPMLSKMLARRYPVIICDEHQDSSQHQEAIILLIGNMGSKLRIFGDPMQVIPGGHGQAKKVIEVQSRWEVLKATGAFGKLEVGHRWKDTNPALGAWILDARKSLQNGQTIDLSSGLPVGVHIHFAENRLPKGQGYQLSPDNGDWKPINTAVDSSSQMLCLAARSSAVDGLRATFKPRLSIWEGHSSDGLEKFIEQFQNDGLPISSRISAFVDFLQTVMSGFNSRFVGVLKREVERPTKTHRGQITPVMASMARLIVDGEGHAGYSAATALLQETITSKRVPFNEIRIDYPRELNDLIQLKNFADPSLGLAEISQRRSRVHPSPPGRCLSTIHKAKGLERQTVILFAADGTAFPDNLAKRNLLYVALSRASKTLHLVISKSQPTAMLKI